MRQSGKRRNRQHEFGGLGAIQDQRTLQAMESAHLRKLNASACQTSCHTQERRRKAQIGHSEPIFQGGATSGQTPLGADSRAEVSRQFIWVSPQAQCTSSP